MKIIQVKNKEVVVITNAREDVGEESVYVVDEIPTFIPKEGYNGVLMYDVENGLYWDYVEAPIEEVEEPKEIIE